MTDAKPTQTTRRQLLKSSVAAGSTAALTAAMTNISAAGTFHAHGTDSVRVGLIGCGGRGSGAAANAMRGDPNTKLTALGDVFEDQAEKCHANLQKQADFADRIDVPKERRFTGFDAYKGVIDSSDVVLFATSPHFRPMHVRAAVEAGKHMFVEKPVAVDGPGLRHIWESCRMAEAKGISLVSGLCYRYQFAKQETIKRIHDGAIGDITSMQCTYNTGGLWHRGRQPEWTDMEWQMRNWLYFTWLSGDHIAEQHIHSLDKLLWAMGDVPPESAVASGGRISRTDPKYGNVYDHFNTTFEWPGGIRGFSSCRQIVGAASDVSDWCFGTKGRANIQRHTVESGGDRWRYRGEGPDDMYQNEHDMLFAAIRDGKPINNGEYMCNATLMALMGRLSAYTGQKITREQALNSQEDLSPPSYAWGPLESPAVAVPGVTKFV